MKVKPFNTGNPIGKDIPPMHYRVVTCATIDKEFVTYTSIRKPLQKKRIFKDARQSDRVECGQNFVNSASLPYVVG
jgi:hypothetical protein